MVVELVEVFRGGFIAGVGSFEFSFIIGTGSTPLAGLKGRSSSFGRGRCACFRNASKIGPFCTTFGGCSWHGALSLGSRGRRLAAVCREAAFILAIFHGLGLYSTVS